MSHASFENLRFTASEIERATGLARKTIELLKREKLGPKQISPSGRGRSAHWDFAGFSWFSTIQLLSRVIQNPVQAARLAEGIVPEILRNIGCVPLIDSNLQSALEHVDPNAVHELTVSDKARLRAMVDAEGSFARDYTLVIANDKYVAEGRWGALPNFLTLSERGFAPVLVYKRSSRTDAIETELIADPMVHGSVLSKMRSAESLVVLNLSKALRRSLSALLRIREGHI